MLTIQSKQFTHFDANGTDLCSTCLVAWYNVIDNLNFQHNARILKSVHDSADDAAITVGLQQYINNHMLSLV
jgi:hypothetical protein